MLVFCSCFYLGCKNKNTNGNSSQKIDHTKAIPHTTDSQNGQLSAADKNALANAQGKEAELVSVEEMEEMFNHSTEMLHVYSFWKNNNSFCDETNKALLKIQEMVGDTSIRLIFVNIEGPSNISHVNAFIREHNVTSNAFGTSEILNVDWYNQIHPSWSGDVPAIYLKNDTDGINLFYQKNFSEEELMVLIQPFTL